jgi:hypothetical protein
MQDIGTEFEFDLNGAVIIVNPETGLPVPLEEACVGFKGFGVGWDVAKNGPTIQMSRSEFEPDGTDSLTWQQADWIMAAGDPDADGLAEWEAGKSYTTGTKLTYDDKVCEVQQNLTSDAQHPPGSDNTKYKWVHVTYDYWFTGQLDRPLDMPVQPYNAVLTGMADRPLVTSVFACDLTHTRCKFRLGSPVDPAKYDAKFAPPDAENVVYPMARPYVRLHVSGSHASPPKASSIPCQPDTGAGAQSVSLATIAKTYYEAAKNCRGFVYGQNWTYRGKIASLQTELNELITEIGNGTPTEEQAARIEEITEELTYYKRVNDECGRGAMECDVVALMSSLGMPIDQSPYNSTTPNQTADFFQTMHNWLDGATPPSANVPWIDYTKELVQPSGGTYVAPVSVNKSYYSGVVTDAYYDGGTWNGLGGRIVDQGAMAWWFWDKGYVFRPEVDGVLDLSQLRSGDLVMFRRAKSTFFDNVGHIGVIDVDTDGTIYVIHATIAEWTDGKVIVRSRLEDEFFNLAPGRYKPEDMYFARIPYGSTGTVAGSYIPSEDEGE